MKKTLITLQTLLVSITLTQCVVYAGDPRLTASLSGEDIPVSIFFDPVTPEAASTTATNQSFSLDGATERLEINQTLLRNSTPTPILSLTDLKNFSKVLIYQNSDIKTILVEDDRVSITRIIPSKLFSLISLPVEETLTVISWGNQANQVVVSHSWWDMFSTREITEDAIADDLEARIKSLPAPLFTRVLTTEAKALILLEIQSIFNTTGSTTNSP